MRCHLFSVFVLGIALSFALVLFSIHAEAQIVTVTFNLNMANETVSPDGPYLASGADFGVPGCMDAAAVNYHQVFTQDNGTCVFADDLGGSQCPSDLNGDNLVGVADLLILLGEFGVPCTP
jgi:hypothetical protein